MDSQEKVRRIVSAALDKKGDKPIVFDTHELTDVTDYVVVVGGTSDRQVRAIADNIEDSLRSQGEKPIGVEGQKEGRWILLDYVDIIVHVFYHPVREYYDIERLWMDAPRYIPDVAGLSTEKTDGAPETGIGR